MRSTTSAARRRGASSSRTATTSARTPRRRFPRSTRRSRGRDGARPPCSSTESCTEAATTRPPSWRHWPADRLARTHVSLAEGWELRHRVALDTGGGYYVAMAEARYRASEEQVLGRLLGRVLS